MTTAGESYAFSPFTKNDKVLPQQVYVVRISDGQNNISLRMINVGTSNAASFFDAENVVSLQSSPSLAKAAAADGIRAGKTGFFGTTVQITSYSEKVANIVLKDARIEKRVDSLLAMMNIKEKCGQLLQPSRDNYSASDVTSKMLGSYLKGEGGKDYMEAALKTRLKIPLLVGNDWVHGGRHVYFPHNIGQGCANDTLLTELAYRIYSMMCLPLYNNENFAPCLDVHRDYRSGRVYESFGESPELVSLMARAAVRGCQGTDLTSGYTMAATLKHWAAAGGSGNGITRYTANVNTATFDVLAKIHFPPFAAAIKAGAVGVMSGYPDFMGTPMVTNKQLITDVLKDQKGMGFDGFVITDWATSADLNDDNRSKYKESIEAGHDMLMTVDPDKVVPKIEGIDTSRINDAVRRLLRTKFRMGLFENPFPNDKLNDYLASKAYRDVARACVRKSLVLLKNEKNALPLSKTAKIYVVGDWADNLGYQCGGWSATGTTIADNTNKFTGNNEGWQGTSTPHAIKDATTIWEGIKAACSNATYTKDANNIQSDADVIVVVVGEEPYAETDGDRPDINLNNSQIQLVEACKAKANGKPVVTILVTGRPNAIGSIPEKSDALVAAWLPGTEGNGVSDVLFNDYDFSGKLAFTWPKNNNQNPIHEGNLGDVTGSDKSAPLYKFGHGLTYK
jgi:beta-glucosidase